MLLLYSGPSTRSNHIFCLQRSLPECPLLNASHPSLLRLPHFLCQVSCRGGGGQNRSVSDNSRHHNIFSDPTNWCHVKKPHPRFAGSPLNWQNLSFRLWSVTPNNFLLCSHHKHPCLGGKRSRVQRGGALWLPGGQTPDVGNKGRVLQTHFIPIHNLCLNSHGIQTAEPNKAQVESPWWFLQKFTRSGERI